MATLSTIYGVRTDLGYVCVYAREPRYDSKAAEWRGLKIHVFSPRDVRALGWHMPLNVAVRIDLTTEESSNWWFYRTAVCIHMYRQRGPRAVFIQPFCFKLLTAASVELLPENTPLFLVRR